MNEPHNPNRNVEDNKRRRPTLALTGMMVLAMTLSGGCGPRAKADEEARKAQVMRDVTAALNQATALREQSKSALRGGAALLAQAREQAQRALALVENGPADDTLKTQVRKLQAELDEEEKDRALIAALDEARLAQAATVAGESRFAAERAVPLFREAFRAYGLPGGEGKPAAAAARIRQRPAAVREAIVAALDEWDDLAGNPKFGINEPHREWLRAVLEAAEPVDGWGRKLRAARREADPAKRQAALEALLTSADIRNLPARSLTRLAVQLRPPQAAALLRRAWQHYPADFWVNHNLGLALTQVTPPEWNEAVRFLTAAVALRPDTPGAYLNLGAALSGTGQLDEAVASFRKAIELEPKYAQAHNSLGHALLARGQTDEAIACWRRAITLDPKLAAAHGNLGSALSHKGQIDEAIASYRMAIALDPRQAAVHVNLGSALKDKGMLDEAIACYRKAIELDPRYAGAHNNLGMALKDKGQVEEAIACYQKAIALDPKDAKAHTNLGTALYGKGQVEEAIACYRQAIQLDPKKAEPHANLAHVLANAANLKLRDPVQAVAEARKATELAPQFWMGWCNLGEGYYRNGQWQEAIAALDKGLALLKSENGEIFLFLAMAHHRAGHKDEARKWYDRGIAWMDKHAPKDPTLLRYRNQAVGVLGVK
jgi:tetratricopeptide (TPR) repeat protein